MFAPGRNKKLIEIVKQLVGAAAATGQFLSPGSLNLPFDAALVKSGIDSFDILIKVDPMEIERSTFCEGFFQFGLWLLFHRPKLHVFLPGVLSILFNGSQQGLKCLRPVHQRLAVVGERQRDQTAPGQPAIDAAEGDYILQALSGWRGRIGYGRISVSPLQCLEPGRRMKD